MKDEEKKEQEIEEEQELRDFQSIEIDSPEELQQLLDQLAGSGNNGTGKKIKKIGFVNRLFPNIFVNLLFYIGFISLVTFALQGYLEVFNYDHLYKLAIFCVAFGTIDTLGRDLLYSKIPFIVLTSIGSVILLLTIGSSIGVAYLIPAFGINNYWMYVVYIVVLLILRVVITSYLSRILHPIFRKKFLKKKGK